MALKPYHHAKARYLGGTKVEFTCVEGHVWREDMAFPQGKRRKHIRLSEGTVAMLARYWEKGVTVCCPECWKATRSRRPGLKRSP